MSTKKKLNKLKIHLNKNIVSIYFTPKNQMWGILSDGKKKCIIKKIVDNTELNSFLKSKNIISYEDSKVVKKAKVSFINKSSIKNRCLDFTKKELYDVSSCNKKKKNLDQFYTTEYNTNLCTQLYSEFITVNKDNDIIIEPSAGNGSFIHSIDKLCNNILLIDIDPKHSRIQACDFLTFNKNLNKFKKVHVIGNPPFSIINKFLKQAFKIADSIGFILPLSFRKESRKKVFPLNFHCVHEHIFLNNNFYFNGHNHKVPTVFQIWEKRIYNRDVVVKINSKFVEFVKKKDNPTVSFRRVGGRCGEISTIIHDKSESSHYFIKLKGGLDIYRFFETYRKIIFPHNNTVGPKSVSQQELLKELNKHGISKDSPFIL